MFYRFLALVFRLPVFCSPHPCWFCTLSGQIPHTGTLNLWVPQLLISWPLHNYQLVFSPWKHLGSYFWVLSLTIVYYANVYFSFWSQAQLTSYTMIFCELFLNMCFLYQSIYLTTLQMFVTQWLKMSARKRLLHPTHCSVPVTSHRSDSLRRWLNGRLPG